MEPPRRPPRRPGDPSRRGSRDLPPDTDADGENRILRARLVELAAAAARNEALLAKTQQRELELLRAGSLAELLERLVPGLREAYALDRVTLLLDDPQHEVRHLASGGQVGHELLQHVRHADRLDTIALALDGLAKPWLGSRLPAEARRALNASAVGGSYAFLPLPRGERRLGILVLESRDPARFTPDLASDFLGHLGVVAAICLENAVNHARLLRTGVTDFLTGFHNRRYLSARLREELARAQRVAGSVALLMIDVDHFKQINDTHGHLAGDAVLQEIARRIASQIRSSDTGARFGGDEFAVLLGGGRAADLERLAGRLTAAMGANPVSIGEADGVRVTLSIGGALAEPAPDERDYRALAERLMAEADAALYRAKSAGRDRFVIAARAVR
ncbi:MAG: sensor domain-containing diguanylate cyclase [Steroidobacteraceae bacterium]|nr:sensor domain-containing diguanylate cyclase [Steroidobacteraceae bacterium]